MAEIRQHASCKFFPDPRGALAFLGYMLESSSVMWSFLDLVTHRLTLFPDCLSVCTTRHFVWKTMIWRTSNMQTDMDVVTSVMSSAHVRNVWARVKLPKIALLPNLGLSCWRFSQDYRSKFVFEYKQWEFVQYWCGKHPSFSIVYQKCRDLRLVSA